MSPSAECEADQIELTVALHAARGNAGAAREAAAARFDRYGPHDGRAVIFAAWVGDAGSRQRGCRAHRQARVGRLRFWASC